MLRPLQHPQTYSLTQSKAFSVGGPQNKSQHSTYDNSHVPPNKSNSFTYVYLQQTSLSLPAFLSKTWAKLSVSPPNFKTILKFHYFKFISIKLHKNRLWVGQVRNCLIHNNDRRFFSFPTAIRLVLGPTPPPIQCTAGGLSTRNNMPRCEAACWPPPNAKVKNIWRYASKVCKDRTVLQFI